MTITRRRGSLTKQERATQKNLNDNRCVAYIRVSTNDQENSIHSQTANTKRYADFHHLDIQETFTDQGESAFTKSFSERPSAKRLLAYIKKHNINTILFLRPDRAFRNTLDCCNHIKEFNNLGINVRFIDNNIDLATPEGKLVLQMMVMFAEWECEIRAQRVAEGYEQLRAERFARSPNAIPYGWNAGPIETTTNGKKRTRLIVNPTEQSHLTTMIKMRNLGQTLRDIADHLNHQEIPSKHAGKTYTRKGITKTCSGKWTHQSVLSVLEHAVIATSEELTNAAK